jgi:hypothetical protein
MAYVERVGKRWRGVYRDPGGNRKSKVQRTRGEAKYWAERHEHEVEEGTYIDPKAGALTFGQYVDRWLATDRQTPGRIDQVARTIRRHMLTTFGDTPLRDMTSWTIQLWVYGMADRASRPRRFDTMPAPWPRS